MDVGVVLMAPEKGVTLGESWLRGDAGRRRARGKVAWSGEDCADRSW